MYRLFDALFESINEHQAALEVIKKLKDAGFEAYIVGGSVRDKLIGKEPNDYDIATSAMPDDVERIFPNTISLGREFGIVIVQYKGFDFEIATFRKEQGYSDGRLPDEVIVGKGVTAYDDASRRDFTINALYMDHEGNIKDFVGGEADLKRKLIRAIGDPEQRFNEDYLRMLRAVRFAAKMGFSIDPATFKAIQKHAAKIAKISKERVYKELSKTLSSKNPVLGMQLLWQSNLGDHIFPRMDGNRVIRRLNTGIKNPVVQWALIYYDMGNGARKAMTKLSVPNTYKDPAVYLIRTVSKVDENVQKNQYMLADLLRSGRVTPQQLNKFVKALDIAGDLKRGHEIKHALSVIKKIRNYLLLSGADLKKLGVRGKRIGEFIRAIKNAQIAGKVKGKRDAIEFVKSLL